MTSAIVERFDLVADCTSINAHTASEPGGEGHGTLVEGNFEGRPVPRQATWPDREVIGVALQIVTRAFGHCPALACLAVEGNVQRTVVFRLATAAKTRQSVIRRKDAADERNDGECVGAVIADRIYVPPSVPACRDCPVEANPARTCAAARRPEIAAIGTPGPG